MGFLNILTLLEIPWFWYGKDHQFHHPFLMKHGIIEVDWAVFLVIVFSLVVFRYNNIKEKTPPPLHSPHWPASSFIQGNHLFIPFSCSICWPREKTNFVISSPLRKNRYTLFICLKTSEFSGNVTKERWKYGLSNLNKIIRSNSLG